MSDHNPKIEIDPELVDEAMKAVKDSKADEKTKESEIIPVDEKLHQEPTADEYRDRWVRVTADFDNFRKRVQKEKSDLIKYGNENLIKELLPVLDNFERALATSPASSNESFIQGVQMIYTQLIGALERFGLTSESVQGKQFDPNLHEAMNYKDAPELPPHSVVDEHQKMYFLNKKLIRPALVTVSKSADEVEDSPTIEMSPDDNN
jgi:molecular chaperone GrpE